MSGERPGGATGQAERVRRRGWLEIRWRQFRNPPRPVLRAVLSDLGVAVVLSALYLAYDVALSRGAELPGGDLRPAAVALVVVLVVIAGSTITWLVVPLPGAKAAGRGTRSGWSAALGFFASLPIAYLALVVAVQIIKPLLV